MQTPSSSFRPAQNRLFRYLRRTAIVDQVIAAGIAIGLTAFAGCASKPIIPEAKNVKVAREDARPECKEIGPVQGSVSTTKGTIEQAIEDMRLDAARKGANFVRMQATSALGTSVSGTAYDCP